MSAHPHHQSEPHLRGIPPDTLISVDFVRFTRDQALDDGFFDIYLHRPAGPELVNGGAYGAQTIQTLAMDDDFVAFFQDAVQRLDNEIDLDFRFVETPNAADLRFYFDNTIDLGGSSLTLGIALINDTPQRDFWEVMLNTPAFNGDRTYLYYAALHELYHPLGGEHPFDSSDGDVFVSRNSSLSAYPEETLMAYRSPLGPSWPTAFTANDISVLKSIWGEENDPVVDVLAQPVSEGFFGSTGLFGSRALRSELANDLLIGGGGHQRWLMSSHDGLSNARLDRRRPGLIEVLDAEEHFAFCLGNCLEAYDTLGELGHTELFPLNLRLPFDYTSSFG